VNLNSYQRVLLYLVSVLLLTSLLSPWVYALWDLLLGPWIAALTEWQDHRYSLAKIFNRLFMILAISLFFPCRRLLKIGSMDQLGLRSMREGYRDLLKGFAIALAAIIFLGAVMGLAEVFTIYFRLPFSVGLERSIKAMLAALTVGFLEEIFFRGMILKGLLEDWRPTGAFIGASLFYSAIHFVKPAQKSFLEGLEPLAGFSHLIHTFEQFLDPLSILPGLIGLFLLGMLLSYAFFRTNSLYLSIGLHAGLVFGVKTIRVYGNYTREDLGWIFGSSDPKIISGIAAWIGIIAMAVFIHTITRRRQKLMTEKEI
jgi:membrane protease YdiL (CAAX protease family)